MKKNREKDQEFNETLRSMKRFTFTIGGYFGGYRKRTYTISGEEVLFDADHSLYGRPIDPAAYKPFTREAFLQGIAKLHIGEWEKEYMNPHVLDGTQWSIEIEYENGHKPVQIYGSNAFPENFNDLIDFLETGGERTGYESAARQTKKEGRIHGEK